MREDGFHPETVADASTEDAFHYAMFVSLDGRVCLVVGGGNVGERKVRGLLACGATVRLVAESLSPWLEAQAESGSIDHAGTHFDPQHMEGADLVFAATSDRDLNRLIADHAQTRRLWCNTATDPEKGSFIVPAVLRRGPLTVAFSTGGLSPALAKRIREHFEGQFDVNWELFVRLLGRLRQAIQSKGLDSGVNQSLFRDLAALPIPQWLAFHEEQRVLPAIQAVCGEHLSADETTRIWKELCNQSYSPWQPFATAAARSDT